MWSLELVTGPAVEPISLAEAKAHLRVEVANDDELIDSLIAAVRQGVEERGYVLITQTWDLHLDRFPGVIRIPRAPVQSIDSVSYVDTDGATQPLALSLYTADLTATPARIVPAYGESWPATRPVPKAVTVRFVAGYGNGATPDLVPERVLQAMKVDLAGLYYNRSAMLAGAVTPLPTVDRLLDNYTLYLGDL
jgi:uncharacterized phiE125 gp8 family phage protein